MAGLMHATTVISSLITAHLGSITNSVPFVVRSCRTELPSKVPGAETLDWERIVDFPHGSFRMLGSRKTKKLDKVGGMGVLAALHERLACDALHQYWILALGRCCSHAPHLMLDPCCLTSAGTDMQLMI